jgi:mannose-1-phosphate guanylyltransferase
LILDGAGYNEVVALGLDFARERGALVTLGIKPSRPDTGYGYIQFEGREGSGKDDPRVRSVRTFTEKPNLSTAKQFLDSGDFYWNSGIFIWSLSSISKAFEVHLPDMHAAFLERALDFSSPNEGAAIAEIYGDCDNISIDYGIMEKSDDVVCVLSDFGWSDLGTWGALYEKIARDDNDNAVSGGALEATESTGNIVVADPSKLVALRGMKDFIVVDTPDALLVCPRSEEQWVKELVTDLKLSNGEPRV